MRARPARPSAREGAAAHARRARAPSDRHLRSELHRPLADQRRVRRGGARAQRRAVGARFRRDQDLRRDGPRRRHHREDGVGSDARRRSVRAARRRASVRAVDHEARAAPRHVPARLRLRLHRTLRADARPGRGRRRPRGNAPPNRGERAPRFTARRGDPARHERAAPDLVVRGAARLAVDAGAVRDRRLPAGVPGDRAGIQRRTARRPADAFGVSQVRTRS